MTTLTLIKPDDAHLHLRDGACLRRTVADAAARFRRAIIMPNLTPPITTLASANDYRQRILAAIPADKQFEPLMTLYLTDTLSPTLIKAAKAEGLIHALKLYPAGVTTHSDAGVTSLEKIYPVLAAMQEEDIPLLVHGETNDPSVDIFDRERVFLEDLATLLERFPRLRVVLEHITTAEAATFVTQASERLAATITAHHLLLNRNHLLSGGIRPHHYCLPVLKRRRHQEALVAAATSGNPKFFLGTDSAPHSTATKECARGCAGVYSAHAAIELYAEVFEQANALSQLEAFASRHAAMFYRLPAHNATITLEKQSWEVPKQLEFGDGYVTPLRAGEQIMWRLVKGD